MTELSRKIHATENQDSEAYLSLQRRSDSESLGVETVRWAMKIRFSFHCGGWDGRQRTQGQGGDGQGNAHMRRGWRDQRGGTTTSTVMMMMMMMSSSSSVFYSRALTISLGCVDGRIATSELESTLNGSRISPGKGETAALPRAGHSARFSISGRRSGAVQSRHFHL